MDLIDNILESREKKLWEGRINRKVLIAGLVLWLVLIAVVSYFIFSVETVPYDFNGEPREISGSLAGKIFLTIALIAVFLNFFSNLVVRYALTNKRIIIKSGLIGTDYKSVYFEQIHQVLVNVDLIGKIFGTGNLLIDTGKTETRSTGGQSRREGGNSLRIETKTMYETLKNIDNPYEIYKLVQPSITGRRESLYSGRADRESNPDAYAKDK